ncbi:Uncharacterized protein OBRU01_25411 [Operophtera brumata]|uniref:Uncharacterized protein n=1 Tax=Operophtera brumata TaxID=104452 RepID=A0A0L7K5N7_OPEBR|nr:Uncharacterized protein OBRU01_25411 [Operophtera brumata]
MFKTPLLILLLLGTTSCENDSDSDIPETPINENHARHRHSHSILPNGSDVNKLSEIRYLRRHLNKEVLNFVMTDYLVDGEVENRVHYNGISAKETYMFKTPLLILLLLGTTSCENDSDSDITETPINENHARHRHSHSILTNGSDGNKLSEIRYLRRHLNKEVLNFVMTDYLVDGEVENRVHYNGISAKETYSPQLELLSWTGLQLLKHSGLRQRLSARALSQAVEQMSNLTTAVEGLSTATRQGAQAIADALNRIAASALLLSRRDQE